MGLLRARPPGKKASSSTSPRAGWGCNREVRAGMQVEALQSAPLTAS